MIPFAMASSITTPKMSWKARAKIVKSALIGGCISGSIAELGMLLQGKPLNEDLWVKNILRIFWIALGAYATGKVTYEVLNPKTSINNLKNFLYHELPTIEEIIKITQSCNTYSQLENKLSNIDELRNFSGRFSIDYSMLALEYLLHCLSKITYWQKRIQDNNSNSPEEIQDLINNYNDLYPLLESSIQFLENNPDFDDKWIKYTNQKIVDFEKIEWIRYKYYY